MKLCSCLDRPIVLGILWYVALMHCTNRLTSLLNLLAELAFVEERSVSIRHMPFNHHRRYSEYHTADCQWCSSNRVPDFDLEGGKSVVL